MCFNLNIIDNRVLTILILKIIKYLFIYFFKQECISSINLSIN